MRILFALSKNEFRKKKKKSYIEFFKREKQGKILQIHTVMVIQCLEKKRGRLTSCDSRVYSQLFVKYYGGYRKQEKKVCYTVTGYYREGFSGFSLKV